MTIKTKSTDVNFRPDWSQRWTAKQAEKELSGFKFHGPGWYADKNDVIIAIPTDRLPESRWDASYEEDETFDFHVYNGRNPAMLFFNIVHAPMRVRG